jgi:hypothetical protein
MALGANSELAALRGPGSATARFYELVDNRGGSSHLLQYSGQMQVTSSWCATSLAEKGYLERSRTVSEERYFHPGANTDLVGGSSSESAAASYRRLAHAPREYWVERQGRLLPTPTTAIRSAMVTREADASNAERAIANPAADTSLYDTSMRYQIAMQMEMLSNMSFPGNNPAEGTVTVYRTEFPSVVQMYGLEVPSTERHPPDPANDGRVGTVLHMRRSTFDSGSLYVPVTITGSLYTTRQEVPYHRIFGSFLLGAGPESTQSCLYSDMMHEVNFMTEGLASTYVGNGAALYRAFEADYQPPAPASPPPAPDESGS